MASLRSAWISFLAIRLRMSSNMTGRGRPLTKTLCQPLAFPEIQPDSIFIHISQTWKGFLVICIQTSQGFLLLQFFLVIDVLTSLTCILHCFLFHPAQRTMHFLFTQSWVTTEDVLQCRL